MKIDRITLQEWHSFASVDVDLSRLSVVSVLGRLSTAPEKSNGAGKSFFLESILYALFGYDREPTAIQRLKAEDDTFVEVRFQHRGQNARVKRGFKIKRDGTPGEGFLEFELDGQRKGKGVNDTKPEIIAFLGCDFDLYTATCFFTQEDSDQFAKATASGRKEVLAALLGLLVYETARQIAEKEASKHRGTLDTLTRSREAETIQADAAAQSIKALENKGLPRLRATSEALLADLEALREDGPVSLAGLRDLAAEPAALAAEVGRLRERLAEAKRATKNAADAVQGAQDRKAARRRALETEYQERVAVIRRIPERTAALETERGRLAALRAERDASVVEEKAPWTRQSQDAAGEAAVAKADLKRAQESITAIDNLQALCGTCGQVIPEQHRADHRAEAVKARDDAQARFTAALAKSEAARVRLDAILAAEEKRRGIDTQIVRVESAVSSAQTALDSDKKVEVAHATAIESAKAELSDMDLEIARLSGVHSEAVEREGQIATLITEADARYREAAEGIDQGAEAAVNRLLASVRDRISQEREIRDKIVREQDALATNTRQLADRTKRVTELDTMHKAETFDLRVKDFLATAFSKNGIPMLVMENVVSEIERATVEILEAMESQFRVRFRTETNTGRDTLQIEVETPDGVRGLKSFSGGQVTEINLAIRLALAEVLSRRADVSFDSIFLDEVMAPLDAPARQCFLKVVNLVRRSFKQVFVISHHGEIRDVLESAVVVTWTPEGSVVEVSA